MKHLSQIKSLARLNKLKSAYRTNIQTNYESNAKDCLTCETKGACCLDAHFVNVHITRLEAVAMCEVLGNLDKEKLAKVNQRVSETIKKYDLKDSGDTFAQTFACPLFEKNVGCLVHTVKPVPCIQHACYEFQKDLPPDELQEEVEGKIERLNQQAYGNPKWLPLPIWINSLNTDESD